jgi:alcohol dehydrogenase class IV
MKRFVHETVGAQVVFGASSADAVADTVPVEDAELARALAQEHRADCVVAVGGGWTVGLPKAIALTTPFAVGRAQLRDLLLGPTVGSA